jgi:hypothetical protein
MSSRRHLHRESVVVAALAVLAATGCSRDDGVAERQQQQPDSPRLVFDKSIGDVTLNMARAAVERRYGEPAREEALADYFPFGTQYHGQKLERAVYRLHDGVLQVQYVAGRVKTIETTSTYYRTASRIGVGTRLPRDRCIRLDEVGYVGPRGCKDTWRGFRFDGECLDAWLSPLGAETMTLLQMHTGREIERVLIGDPSVILPCF